MLYEVPMVCLCLHRKTCVNLKLSCIPGWGGSTMHIHMHACQGLTARDTLDACHVDHRVALINFMITVHECPAPEPWAFHHISLQIKVH